MGVARSLCLFMSIQAAPLYAALMLQGLSGIMLQPNSQYFHAFYGAAGTLKDNASLFLASLTYLERPKFTAAGFSDQEQGLFLTVGRELFLVRDGALQASAGMGRQQGYLSEDGSKAVRTYGLNGLTAEAKLLYTYRQAQLSIGHLSFVGFDGREQLRAYVAWPFSYFHVGIGLVL